MAGIGTGWKVKNPNDFWAFANAYLNEIHQHLLSLRNHQGSYVLVPELYEQAESLSKLIDRIRGELEPGVILPTSLETASPGLLYEGTRIFKPIDLSKPDYRRLRDKDDGAWSAFFRLDYSVTPHLCVGVRFFYKPDEPQRLEEALETQYQQMLKKRWEQKG